MYLQFLINAIVASIASVGFSMVFNVPKKMLFYCGLGGSVVISVRNVLLMFQLSLELSSFLASLLIGFIAFYWSNRFEVPRLTLAVPSIIPIIPGVFAIESMITLMSMNYHGVTQELLNNFFYNSLKSLTILGAISVGLALPSLLFKRKISS